ncbi:WXG100 family type VII secretion target [Actinoplanes solisilvae]|uniref:WXG100 family type VII secretion target n=1 Tax=Actinoplanes solisilvae TaxID=2486853 RepID=UPI000FDC08B8|nr:WXG100 family type VII secretion target [Actinoplanes solisilvae]
MTAQWGINPENLLIAQGDSQRTAESIEAQIDLLKRYVETLCEHWQGVAGGTFLLLMGDFNRHADGLKSTLETISADLGTTHRTVSDTEHTNVQLLTPFAGSGANLSPARF